MMRKEKSLDPAYWEKVLGKYKLGLVQPMTDNSEGEMAEVDAQKGLTGHGDKDFHSLRKKMDGSDTFMDGHQITSVRGVEREIPEWVFNDTEVQRILLASFPTWRTNPRQAKRAGRWARVIYLHYRMKLPRQLVAKELGITESALETLTRGITRASRGLTWNGKPRKRHSSDSQCTTQSEVKERGDETIQGPLLHNSGDGSNGEDGTPQS